MYIPQILMNARRGKMDAIRSVSTPMDPTTVPVDLVTDFLLMATLALVS